MILERATCVFFVGSDLSWVAKKELDQRGKTFQESSSSLIASALFTPWDIHYVWGSYRFVHKEKALGGGSPHLVFASWLVFNFYGFV